jgi:hypothetical protein
MVPYRSFLDSHFVSAGAMEGDSASRAVVCLPEASAAAAAVASGHDRHVEEEKDEIRALVERNQHPHQRQTCAHQELGHTWLPRVK